MTLGRRWVCSGSRCAGAMLTASTRTRSLSIRILCEPGAAWRASISSGHGHEASAMELSREVG
jgi:hypothetical protein